MYSCLKNYTVVLPSVYMYHVWENWAAKSKFCELVQALQAAGKAVSPARVQGQQGWGREQTPAWLCPMGSVCEFTGNYPSPSKGPGCPSVLTAASLFFIILEVLLKCPQAMLWLLGFSLPKFSWLFWVPLTALCLIQKFRWHDPRAETAAYCSILMWLPNPPQFENLWK